MPKIELKASEELQPFFNELPLPQGLNGREVNICNFNGLILSTKLPLVIEIYRRMQDLYDSFNSGRLFLGIAQRNQFPEIYKEPIPSWGINWVKIQFLLSSIYSYNSTFDLYLQVNWLYFELFKYDSTTSQLDFSGNNLERILNACKRRKFNTPSIKQHISNNVNICMSRFKSSESYNEIRKLCNMIKHKRRISFKELSEGKHPFYLDFDNYNSHQTLIISDISHIIKCLKNYHHELKKLCDASIPSWDCSKFQS